MGILNQGMPPTQDQTMPPAQGQEIQLQGGKNNQDAYDKFVINGLKILHSSEITDSIVNRVKNAPDKVDAVGEISLDVINRLEQSANQNNFPVTANTVLNGANVIVGEVVTIAEAAGMEPMSDEQKYQAFIWTFGNYINNAVKSGRITKETLVQLGQKMAQTSKGKEIASKALEDEKGQGMSAGNQQGGM